jgi:hypothetical protein
MTCHIEFVTQSVETRPRGTMKETGNSFALFGVVLAVFAAAPAVAQPAGPPPGKAEAKSEKAAEKAEAKAANAGERAAAKAAKAEEKGAAKGKDKDEKAEGRGPHDHDRHGAPGAGPSGHPPGAHPPHGHRGFRRLGHEFARGTITKAELEKRVAEMRASKAERKREHGEGLRHRWGMALAHPAVREELRHHARREAFLDRALFLAQTQVAPKDRDKLVERIEKLIEKEEQRHMRAMERLKSMPLPPASAAAAASGAAVAPGASAAPTPSAASSGKAGEK